LIAPRLPFGRRRALEALTIGTLEMDQRLEAASRRNGRQCQAGLAQQAAALIQP
jgi:hypothetical protein